MTIPIPKQSPDTRPTAKIAGADILTPPISPSNRISPSNKNTATDTIDTDRVDLVGLPRTRIEALLCATGAHAPEDVAANAIENVTGGLDKKAARLRTKQLWHWIYHRGVRDFSAMSDISKTMRPWLAARFIIGRPQIISAQISSDGTRKWLLAGDDGQEYEMVFIPDDDRGTLCISSQVGCTLNCRFCHTGTMRWVRNLTVGEIVGQVMLARDQLGAWPITAKIVDNPASSDRASQNKDTESSTANGEDNRRFITNIVLMGMGEPLYNFESVKAALQIIMDGDGMALSRRRITLSTSGVVPIMARVGAEIGVNLAVSLHAVTDAVRDELVPLNRKYPIADLLAACAAYPGLNNARRITFEYVMLKGKNDSDADARALVRLLRAYGVPAKVNLIPFNVWPGTEYVCSSPKRIRAFSNIVFASGISAPIRTPRGRDIMAACGQLKSAAIRLPKHRTPPSPVARPSPDA